MSLIVGRCTLDCPYNITHDGDRLSFLTDVDGYLTGADADVAKVIRQQLLGLVDNDDEPVVPITWEDDPDWDGFYRVSSVQVIPTEMYLANGYVRHFTVAISATRVGGGFANPRNEVFALLVEASSLTLGVAGDGNHPAQEMEPVIYVPATQSLIDGPSTDTSRDTAAGVSITQIRYGTLGSAGSVAFGVTIIPDPGNAYDASCLAEQSAAGTWWPVVGDQVADTLPTLRVGNGLVRFAVNAAAELAVESWDGSAWRTKLYDPTYASGASTISAPVAATVMLNSVDMASVRWLCPRTGTGDGHAVITATVRLGDPVVDVQISTSTQETWKVTRSTIEAATALSDFASAAYGVRATSNDADGNRYVIFGRAAGTADTTNGGVTLAQTPDPGVDGDGNPSGWGADGFAGAASINFGVGLEVAGSSATAPNDSLSLGGRYQIAASVSRNVAT